MAGNASLGTAKLIAELDATGFKVGLKTIENQTKQAFDSVVQEAARASDTRLGEAVAADLGQASEASRTYTDQLRNQINELSTIISTQEAANQQYAATTDRLREVEAGLEKVNTTLSQSGGQGLGKSFSEARQEAEALAKTRFSETLRAEATAGIGSLRDYRKHLQDQVRELENVVKAQNRASEEYGDSVVKLAELKTELRSVNQELKTQETAFSRFGKATLVAGGALTAGVTLPLAAIGVTGLKSAMQLETFSASLNVLIGDADRAQRVFDELYEFSAKTPFDWRTLSESTRILSAFGTQAEDIVPTLSRLGDIAAGTGSELDSLAEIYGRVQITGRASMQEINSLAQRGIPIYTVLADQLGTTADGVRELVSAGGVGFKEIEKAFTSMTSEGGKFFNMMEEMSKTTEGRLAKLKDSFEQVTDAVGDRVIPIFGSLIDTGQVAVDWFTNLSESTQGLIISLGAIAAALGPVLLGVSAVAFALPGLIAGFAALSPVVLPLIGGAGILAAMTAGFFYLNDAMNEGHRERKRVSDDYIKMVESMGAYRGELKITGEEERAELIASLERRKKALQAVLKMNQTMIRQMEAEVVAFANSPWWKQIFGVGSVNVTMDALNNAEREMATISKELADIDTQIGEVRVMEITVDVDDPSGVVTGGKADKAEDPIVARANAISKDLQRLRLLRESGRMDAETYEGWVQAHLRDLQRLWGESTNLDQKRAVLQSEAQYLTEVKRLEDESENILAEGVNMRERLRQQELDNAMDGYQATLRVAQMEAQALMATGEMDDSAYLRFLQDREKEALEIYGTGSTQYLQARLAVLNQEQRIDAERERSASTTKSEIERLRQQELQNARAGAEKMRQLADAEIRLGRERHLQDPSTGISDQAYLEILESRFASAKAMYGEDSMAAMQAELEVLQFQRQLNAAYESNQRQRNDAIARLRAEDENNARESANRLAQLISQERSIRMRLPEEEGGITPEQNLDYLRQQLATSAQVHGEWSEQWMRDYTALLDAEERFNADLERNSQEREASIRREQERERQLAEQSVRNMTELRDMEINLMRQRGDMSDEDYLALLQPRLEQARALYGEFSREAMTIESEILSLTEKIDSDAAASAKRRADAITAEFDRERRAAEAAADVMKRRISAEIEVGRATGTLSDDDYEVILKQRLDIFPQFSEDWMAAWREMNALQEERNAEQERLLDDAKAMRKEQLDTALTWANVVVSAAHSVKGIFESISSGDTGGAVKGALDIFGDLGAALKPELAPFIKLGTSLLGDMAQWAFGGGAKEAEERRKRDQARSRSVPAISINFNVQQTNQYNGGPRDPANEQAMSRNSDKLFESFFTRVIDPRLRTLERAAGIV